MAASLQDIELAVAAGVRAALQTAGPQISIPQENHRVLLPAPVGTALPVTTGTLQRSVPLPSIRRHGIPLGHCSRRRVKTYTKEVVCLPYDQEATLCPIPRGDTRTRLAQAGLVGKISFSSEWSEEQIRAEISAIFRKAFGLSEFQPFPFEFLSTIKGCKKLMKPQVTPNFPWGGKEVASVCSPTCLYIMARLEVPSQNEYEELSDDSDFESPRLRRRRDEPSNSHGVNGDRQHNTESCVLSVSDTELEGQQRPNEADVHFADFIPIDVDEDEAIEEAVRRSLLEDPVQSLQDSRVVQTLSKEEITGIVKAHSERVVTTGYRPICISRGNVWTSALRQFSRRRFTENTDMLYVTFASDESTNEDAEDFGGPRREFFRLLVKAIYKDSGAFEGDAFV